ncbi:MAG: ABC transporter permease subunit [Planctomycetaceae bacterium]|nr:ABC transporter permease subunit [Planctomycetaceae bacterium]
MNSLWTELVDLPANLSHHLLISILSLLLGILVSLPLALLAIRKKSFQAPVLTFVSIVQTIPSLALLALMVPVLVGVNYLLTPVTGLSLPELGFIPTIVALTLYSLLPILRNSVTGLLNVDPAIKEAAKGVGMTPRQSLWKVELPLALPVIVAGIRTATVWTVGIATLATPVGQKCLGNFIFRGLQTRNWTSVLVGCVAAACLAIVLDSLIGRLQQAIEDRKTTTIKRTGGVLAFILVFGLSAPALFAAFQQAPEGSSPQAISETSETTQAEQEPIVVGAKTFTEQFILAELMTQRLEAAGLPVTKKESLGSTIIFDGLTTGEIDVYVDYTGTIWSNHMQREGTKAPWKILVEMSAWLEEEHGIRTLGTLGFENAYALAMRREDAQRLGIETIADLAEQAPDLTIGGDFEFFGRPEWKALEQSYGLSFGEKTSYESTFMYEAIKRDEVDVISAFSTDGRIEAYELVILDDPRQAIPPYDAAILLSEDVADNQDVVDALSPLIEEIKPFQMRRANLRVDREKDKRTVKETAEWLWDEIEDR